MTSKSSPLALDEVVVRVWVVSYMGLALWLNRVCSCRFCRLSVSLFLLYRCDKESSLSASKHHAGHCFR